MTKKWHVETNREEVSNKSTSKETALVGNSKSARKRFNKKQRHPNMSITVQREGKNSDSNVEDAAETVGRKKLLQK